MSTLDVFLRVIFDLDQLPWSGTKCPLRHVSANFAFASVEGRGGQDRSTPSLRRPLVRPQPAGHGDERRRLEREDARAHEAQRGTGDEARQAGIADTVAFIEGWNARLVADRTRRATIRGDWH